MSGISINGLQERSETHWDLFTYQWTPLGRTTTNEAVRPSCGPRRSQLLSADNDWRSWFMFCNLRFNVDVGQRLTESNYLLHVKIPGQINRIKTHLFESIKYYFLIIKLAIYFCFPNVLNWSVVFLLCWKVWCWRVTPQSFRILDNMRRSL